MKNTRRFQLVSERGRVKLLNAQRYNDHRRRKKEEVKELGDLNSDEKNKVTIHGDPKTP